MENSEQNQSLNDHFLSLQEMLQDMPQVAPRDSIARPPPCALRAHASAASAAGVHAGLKRGREDELSYP